MARGGDEWEAGDAPEGAAAPEVPPFAPDVAALLEAAGGAIAAAQPHAFAAVGGHQVEVLFLLCALLGGPAKVTAQDTAAAAGLVPALECMFGSIDWDAPAEAAAPHDAQADDAHGLHGPGCTCNPANALKLQFLRAVHAFLERDADNRRNKRLLLSPADVARHYGDESGGERGTGSAASSAGAGGAPTATQPSMMSAMAAARRRLTLCIARAAAPRGAPAPPLPPLPLPPSPLPATLPPAATAATGETGLMGKLLRRLVLEPPDSPHRFWLASCAEAFLRGSRPADQRFAAASGLMPHLLADVLSESEEGPKPSGALQISCDLLGELIKHSRPLFCELDAALAAVPGRLARLTGVLMAHLVDSNVLLRAVALSLEAFRAQDDAAAAAAAGGADEGMQHGDLGEQRVISDDGDDAAMADAEDAGADGEQALRWPRCEAGAARPAGALGAWLCAEWLTVLEALMSTVSAADVDQENVCVINTALVLLIFTHRAGRLPAALAALRRRRRPEGDPRPPPCVAFAALLMAWRGHYHGRSRDCASLEFSTVR
jgi:hypothetical protein